MFLSATLVWLALWSTVLLFVGMLRKESTHHPAVKILLAPGIALDGVLRGLGCLLSGTKVEKINVLRPGPFMELDRAPIKHIGPAILVTTRLFGAFAALYLFMIYFPDLARSTLHLPIFDPEQMSAGHFEREAIDRFLEQIAHLPAQLKVHRLSGWVFVYVTVSFLIATGLTGKEYLAAIYTILVFHGIGMGCSWLGVTFGFLSRGQLIGFFYSEGFWSSFSLLFLLSVAAIFALLPIRIILAFVKKRGASDGGGSRE